VRLGLDQVLGWLDHESKPGRQGQNRLLTAVSLSQSLETLILIDAVSPGKQTRNCSGTPQNSGWRCVPAK